MICEEIHTDELKVGDWFKISEHEVTTVNAIIPFPLTLKVKLTNGRSYSLHKKQSVVERVLYMGMS